VPTDAHPDLLDRELSKAAAREHIDLVCPLLREVVNHATQAFIRCTRAADESRRGGENEDVAVFILYRQLIEQVDAIEVLLGQCCALATTPLLRSAFEASLSLDFIVADAGKYVERSLCWLCADTHRKIALHERHDSRTPARARFAAAAPPDMSPLPSEDSTSAIAALQGVLDRPQFAFINSDFLARQARRKGRPPDWFSLLGGPSDRRALTAQTGREFEYIVLYGDWSASTHAETTTAYISGGAGGQAEIARIRDPGRFMERACYAASFLLGATRRVVEHFRPGESMESWYLANVKVPLAQICKHRGSP
jgi:Family of unknown function (DUF5677)